MERRIAKRSYDWEAIKRDYRIGKFSSDRALCRHWDVPESTFRAKKVGNPAKGEKPWQRDLIKEFRVKLKNQSIQDLAQSNGDSAQSNVKTAQNRAADEGTLEDAASAARGIIKKHHVRIESLNDISDSLTRKLLEGLDVKGAEALKRLQSRGESATDMLLKLTKVTAELIKLERQAYNLDDEENESSPTATLQVTERDAEVIKDVFNKITEY